MLLSRSTSSEPEPIRLRCDPTGACSSPEPRRFAAVVRRMCRERLQPLKRVASKAGTRAAKPSSQATSPG